MINKVLLGQDDSFSVIYVLKPSLECDAILYSMANKLVVEIEVLLVLKPTSLDFFGSKR